MVLIRRIFLGLLLLASPAFAQLPPATVTANLTSATCTTEGATSAGCVPLTVAGQASVGIQLTGTWTATATFRGSVNRTTFATITCTPPNSTTGVTSATANGQWTCPVAGLAMVEVIVTAYTSGTVVATLQSALAGGGSSGGGGTGTTTINDPTITTQKAAVNASGQLSITCANCSGSGASAVDNSAFTAGTTSGAPAMGFFHSTIDAVTDGNTATLAMDAKRSLFTVLRDAAGNARGANVTAGSALVVDGSAVTQPVSAAALPLPTGASTAAKQPALGTAGTASTDVITVQGIASMTKLLVTPDSVALPANQSVNVAQINAVTPLMGTGVTGTGSLRVTIATDQAQLTNKLLVTPDANSAVNVAQVNGVTTLMGNGVTGTGSQRVTIASDNTAFAVNGTLQTQTDTVMVGGVNIKEINAVTPLMGNGATGTGALRVSIASDSTGVVQPGNTANTTAWLMQDVPGAANGLSWYNVEPGASDNHVNIKNGAGVVYHIAGFNNSATINYWRLYNAATGFNGCNSATNLIMSGIIPGNSTNAGGFVQDIAKGVTFSTGISICITSAYGQTATTSATASAIEFNVGYK